MSHPVTWARGVRSGERGSHDPSCRCRGHCRSCFDDLAACREMHTRMRAAGMTGLTRRPGRWFCSPGCRREWRKPPRLRRRLRLRAFRRVVRGR